MHPHSAGEFAVREAQSFGERERVPSAVEDRQLDVAAAAVVGTEVEGEQVADRQPQVEFLDQFAAGGGAQVLTRIADAAGQVQARL